MERWLEFPRECLRGQDIMATEERGMNMFT